MCLLDELSSLGLKLGRLIKERTGSLPPVHGWGRHISKPTYKAEQQLERFRKQTHKMEPLANQRETLRRHLSLCYKHRKTLRFWFLPLVPPTCPPTCTHLCLHFSPVAGICGNIEMKKRTTVKGNLLRL